MQRFLILTSLITAFGAIVAVAKDDAVLPFKVVGGRASSTIRLQVIPEFLIARTQREWEAMSRLPFIDQQGEQNGGPGELPAVNFDKQTVAGVILPTHSDTCTGVQIHNVVRSADRILVRFKEKKSQLGKACGQSFTTAFEFVAIEEVGLPVFFKRQD